MKLLFLVPIFAKASLLSMDLMSDIKWVLPDQVTMIKNLFDLVNDAVRDMDIS